MNDTSEQINLAEEYFGNITRKYHKLGNSSSLEDEGGPEVCFSFRNNLRYQNNYSSLSSLIHWIIFNETTTSSVFIITTLTRKPQLLSGVRYLKPNQIAWSKHHYHVIR